MDPLKLFPGFTDFSLLEEYRPRPPVPAEQREDFLRYLRFLQRVCSLLMNCEVEMRIADHPLVGIPCLLLGCFSQKRIWSISVSLPWLEESFIESPIIPVLTVLYNEGELMSSIIARDVVRTISTSPDAVGFIHSSEERSLEDVRRVASERLVEALDVIERFQQTSFESRMSEYGLRQEKVEA